MAKSTQTDFWKAVFVGAQAAATEYNMDLTIDGPETEEDYETQKPDDRQSRGGRCPGAGVFRHRL